MGKFLILFLIITFSEVYLMKVVAEKTSFLFLLGVVITTGIIGLSLAKKQGRDHLIRIQEEISQGRIPGNPLVEGLMILVAAAVLITPGFITDVLGFLFLIPFVRRLVAPKFAGFLKPKATGSSSTFFHFSSTGFPPQPGQTPSGAPQQKETVDADFFDMPENEAKSEDPKRIED